MESMESSTVPPGFRFHPTDEELVGYYLRKKIASQKIDLDVIREIDLYRIEPWDLIETCRIGYEEQNEWYFFSHKDKKYPTGTRTNRATIAGFWKATGRDKAVYSKTKLIGMRKTLVFYKGRAPNGQKTEWIMHEYRLELDDQNGSSQEEGWVVCRAFKKRTTTTTNNGQNKNNVEVWDSSYFYEDQSNGSISSIVDPLHDYILSKQPKKFLSPTNFIYYKQENIEADSLSSFMMKSDQQEQFVQLPQLESPSLPLIKRSSPSLISLYDDQEDQDQQNVNNKINNKKVTDWRALDKFVASQLSQEDNIGESSFSGGGGGGGGYRDSNETASLFLQRSRDEDEDHKLNACDIGICMFEKLRN